MNLPVIEIGIIIAATIAVVNRIQAEAPKLKDYWYTIMSFVVGAAIYSLVIYAPSVITTIFFIGAAASGIYDIFKTKPPS